MASSLLAEPSTLQENSAAAAAVTTTTISVKTTNERKDEEDALSTCANDPEFAVICAFMQKFAKDLGLNLPNFRQLQEWLTNTDEVPYQLRDLHIKLLRKTRKTVHEKSWEGALSKFCFTYSAQDGWEVERFGYKKSSLKVKLRILRELLESQFERNGKFRAKILTLNANSLRSQPIGRDRLGHSYWLTQDDDCNLRIYQEHLDEEIWQVVATNRDEFVKLIARLRGNEVVLPSTDIGVVDEDTSSSNSCAALIEKPPPPEEQDDSQEEDIRVPNLRIKLGNNNAKVDSADMGKGEEELAAEEDARQNNKPCIASKHDDDEDAVDDEEVEEEEDDECEEESAEEELSNKQQQRRIVGQPSKTKPEELQKKVKPLIISQSKIIASPPTSKKRAIDDVDRSSPIGEELNTPKKVRPSLLDSNRAKKPSKYEKAEDDDDLDEDDGEEEGEEEEDDDGDEECEEDIDSAAAEEDENEAKEIEEDDDDDDTELGDAIEEPTMIVRGNGAGKECDGAIPVGTFHLNDEILLCANYIDGDEEPLVGVAIEEPLFHVSGEGDGEACLVGNTKNDKDNGAVTPPTVEPKATFFFGVPGCLKLSPMKPKEGPKQDDLKKELENDQSEIDNTLSSENNEAELPKEHAELDKELPNAEKSKRLHDDKNETHLEEINENEMDENKKESGGNEKENIQQACVENKTKVDFPGEESGNQSIKTNGDSANIELTIVAEKSKEASAEVVENVEKESINEIKEHEMSVAENHNRVKNEEAPVEVTEQIEVQKEENIVETENIENVSELKYKSSANNNNAENVEESKEQNVQNKDIEETTTKPETPTLATTSAVILKADTDIALPNETNAEPLKESDITKQNEKHEEQTAISIEKEEEPAMAEEAKTIPPALVDKVTSPEKNVETEHLEEDAKKQALNEKTTETEQKTQIQSTPISEQREEKEKNLEEKGVAIDLHTHEKKPCNEPKKINDVIELTIAESTPTTTTAQPTTTISTTSTSSAPLPNRKRRLADFAVPQCSRQSTSESEFELNVDQPDDGLPQPDCEFDDELDIGGKRLKMRAKLANTELRKKVEAQKVTVDETTSSSGEEDARRRRKIILPRKHFDKSQNSPPKPAETLATTQTTEMAMENAEKQFTPAVAKLETTVHITQPVNKPISISISKPTLFAQTTVGHTKQKPTLAEIIERKLKKPTEKTCLAPTLPPPLPPPLLTSTTTLECKSVVDAMPSSATFSPPKKVPITKPLKKNLLTQIRQEESDEETIPRKRTTSETVTNTTPTESVAIATGTSASNKEAQEVVELRKTPDRKTPERQRKRRSSDDAKQLDAAETDSKKEGVSEKLKKNNDEEVTVQSEELKSTANENRKSPTSTKETSPPVTNRRSGRRGGAAVIYTELPQPKRTRGSVKVTPKKDEVNLETPAIEQKKQEVIKQNVIAAPAPATTTTISEKSKPLDLHKITSTSAVIKKELIKTKIADKKDTPTQKPKEEVIKLETLDNKDDKATIAKTPTKFSPSSTTAADTSAARGRGGARKKQDVDTTNIIETADSETPVRQSRRIAQQKIREEAERRKLEEIALRTMKQELKKKKKAEKEADPTVAEPSEHSSSEESEVETKKRAKKKCPGKDGWSSGSEEQEEPEEEDEEPPHYETDRGSLFKSDHEFSPESDLEDESQVVPMKRARTARKEDAEDEDGGDEEACQHCGKSDHPEWILLCDKCDKGYHCSCLSPVLFYIPEGDWYCPPCQQEELIAALEHQLKEFDNLVERKRIADAAEEQRLAEEAVRVEQERLEEEKKRKERKKHKQKSKHRSSDGESAEDNSDSGSENDNDDNSVKHEKSKRTNGSDVDDNDSDDDNEKLSKKATSSKRIKNEDSSEKGKRRRGDGRSRRKAAIRGARRRRRRRHENASESGSYSDSDSGSGSESESSSSSATDSDDEPIYKLRKRRQINVSYRLNEYDDLINSALKKEMDEMAGAGNLGRGKDISTIIEADKEEKARQKQFGDGSIKEEDNDGTAETAMTEKAEVKIENSEAVKEQKDDKLSTESDDDEPIRRKAKPSLKKKPRKLTTLDISSEEDNASDEDFKTSSLEDEEDEDTSISVSTNSDSSLEVYRRRNRGGKKKQRKAARRAARERRKVRKFVVDESDDEEEEQTRPKSKKKRRDDSDYSESDTGDDDELSELSENVDSADLCDDTTSEDSDGAWRPSKRAKKQRKSNSIVARKSPKLKKPQTKKPKRVEYSDDDISETEEEEDDDEDDGVGGGKGSGKQPRSQPLKPSTATKVASKSGKGKGKSTATKKKKKKLSENEDSFSDSEDSTRRTRGRRYAYLEDFDDDSSDGGIKPGVKRPDTPPEEREKFIQKQEEIKRMLAEKNAEGAKLAATPRLTPIKASGDKDTKRTPVKSGDSLSTVPLSVIRQAKVLDIDYLQRKGETVGELDNVDEVDSEFDDADLPDDFPEDMDEEAIARMVEDEENFGAAATRELPAPDEVLRTPNKQQQQQQAQPQKSKEAEKPLTNPSLAALAQMPGATTASGLQEPMRKRLPMPTMHPPLLRHQFPSLLSMPPQSAAALMHRHPGPSTPLLQNALSAPLGQPLHRSFAHHQRVPSGMPLLPPHLMPERQPLPATQPLPGAQAPTPPEAHAESEAKPRGRRKKITPLRDTLQKQQTAAAVTAASHVTNTATDKPESAAVASAPVTANAGSVIKTASATASNLSIAQPPQLYKPPVSRGEASVITRMPHLPPHSGRPSPVGPPGSMYTGADVARYYGPPTQRHRIPLQMPPGMPPGAHPGMRYGPPPPLRGSVASMPNTGAAGARSSYVPTPNAQGEHHGAPLGVAYGPPPPARHAASHLNPYRPPIYGNPNFAPRGAPPGVTLRAGVPPNSAEYAGAPRGYPPYGYYPPPPLTTTQPAHQPTTHSTAAPSSVIVTAPPATSSASASSSAPVAAASAASTAATLPPAANNHAVTVTRLNTKSPTTSGITSGAVTAADAAVALNNKSVTESRKKLTTLEAYTASTTKSPLAIAGESSGSRSSPGMQPNEDSSSTPLTATAAATAAGEGQASEFSGLVSYFSSQHDDYNT